MNSMQLLLYTLYVIKFNDIFDIIIEKIYKYQVDKDLNA